MIVINYLNSDWHFDRRGNRTGASLGHEQLGLKGRGSATHLLDIIEAYNAQVILSRPILATEYNCSSCIVSPR